MGIWRKIVPLIFPGTFEEWLEACKIHYAEIRVYRKRIQYILGMCLFFVPLYYFILTCEDWVTGGMIFSMFFGGMLILDTLSDHYCLLLHRLGYRKSHDAAPGATGAELAPFPRPKLHFGTLFLIYMIASILVACLSSLLVNCFHVQHTRALALNGSVFVLVTFAINSLVRSGRASWLVRDQILD